MPTASFMMSSRHFGSGLESSDARPDSGSPLKAILEIPDEFERVDPISSHPGGVLMSTLSLRLPESLHKRVRDFAQQEGISINQFISTAVAEKMAALTTAGYLEERAKRGSREKFLSVLAKVPDRSSQRGHQPAVHDLEGRTDGDGQRLGSVSFRSLLRERVKTRWLCMS
jgi:hypothetical protein